MTNDELDAIEARARRMATYVDGPTSVRILIEIDVPELVAECRRLREENETLMLDALAADAIRRYERGETTSLRDYAAERGIDVPPAGRAQEGD